MPRMETYIGKARTARLRKAEAKPKVTERIILKKIVIRRIVLVRPAGELRDSRVDFMQAWQSSVSLVLPSRSSTITVTAVIGMSCE